MTRSYSIVCTLLFLSFSCIAFSAQPRITKSRLSDLLQQPTVSAIHRDSKGTLWIGTQQGLHRYDGANLTVFNSNKANEHRIPDSEIKDIAEDIDENLYVATSNGSVLKWDRDSSTFLTIATNTPDKETKFVRLLLSENGSIWLLNRSHLGLYNPVSDTVSNWIATLEVPDIIGTPRDILEDTSGNIWVAGDQGIVRLIIAEQSFETFTLPMLGLSVDSKIAAIELLTESRLLVGTDNGRILIWDMTSATTVKSTGLGESNQAYISKFLMHEDVLIIGTDRGLYLSDKSLSSFEDLGSRGDELSNPNIYTLFQDEKYVWIGTIDGLDMLSFVPFELFNAKNSEINNDILSFEEDHERRFWVGTYDGLYLYDKKTKRHSRFEESAQPISLDQRVATIAATKDQLWLGLIQDGVKIIDTTPGQLKMRKLSSNKSPGAIRQILVEDESGTLLIATYDKGLFRINGNETISYFLEGTLPESSISGIFQSTTGILLAVSGSRLYRYESHKGKYQRVSLKFGLGKKRPTLYSFAQTSNDDILIGTKDHGLFLWSRENQLKDKVKVEPFGIQAPLRNSTIYGIEIDSEGGVWCSTESGIVKLDPTGKLVKRFTTADGLQGNDYTLGASFTSQSGLIYFGGMNGYNRFDPTLVEINDAPSPMRLTDIKLPGQGSRHLGELSKLESLQLTHRDHSVTFQFSVLDFIDAEKNQYRYKLEGFDSEWIENGTRNTATYTNLPANGYVLRVQGANSAGIWNQEGITLDVEMLPAPWSTWWAYLIYCVGLMILYWGSLRIYRSYAIERRSVEVAQEMFETENRADDDLQEQMEIQDEIVFSSYQHSLTTLSLVSDYISSRGINLTDELKSSVTESSIKRISALSSLEDFLSFQAGTPVANLQKYTDSIFADLLKSAPVNPETIITINQVSPMAMPAELASHIAIVIYELLENSVQHAFELNSPANYIQVSLSLMTDEDSSESILELVFIDSGIGVPENIEELAEEGSGIYIVGSIVAKFDGTLEFSGESGTRVTITIPYIDET
ncbi:putative sensor histidine kinase pdtaS [Halioglobus japonicus]|nr:putative sensor histidine kinase pdtaS [Halioglobus japonicus]